MKRCIYINILLWSAILLCGCAGKDQEKKTSDAPEWIMEEINRYNNEDMRQIDIKEDTTVSEGKLVKDETVENWKSRIRPRSKRREKRPWMGKRRSK